MKQLYRLCTLTILVFIAALILLPGQSVAFSMAPLGITPTPEPTNTPLPTDTPVPTNTPVPTETPVPTATQTPTATPTAVPPGITPTSEPTSTPTSVPPREKKEPPILPETGLSALTVAEEEGLLRVMGDVQAAGWAGLALGSLLLVLPGRRKGMYKILGVVILLGSALWMTSADQVSGHTFVDSPLLASVAQHGPTSAEAAFAPSAVDDSPMTRILIPDLEIEAAVKTVLYDGVTWDIEDIGLDAAWLEGTSLPGLGGNTALAGHLTLKDQIEGPFRYLLYLTPGDEIIVETQQNRYVYQVREQYLVRPKILWVVEPTDKPQLTLITCSQWDPETRTYLKRRVLFADLQSVTPLTAP